MAKNLKPGDKVIMIVCAEACLKKNFNKIWTVRSEPWNVCGEEVVLLEGKPGGFATKFLERVVEN